MCGHCALIGKHAAHTPVRDIEDIEAERKEKVPVFAKVEELTQSRSPFAERSLESVDEVNSAISSRA